jgi:hypothetical protein
MWPWGHLAVAYILYSTVARMNDSRLPGGLAVFALAVGSQFPDLIDKPLGWSLGVLPGGRTLAHSVFLAAVLIPLVYVLATEYNRRETATEFSLGYVVHLLTDIPPSVLTGDFAALTSLFSPVLAQLAYEEVGSILEGFLRYSMGGYEWAQLALLALAIVVWYRDGRPGIAYVQLQLERFTSIAK